MPGPEPRPAPPPLGLAELQRWFLREVTRPRDRGARRALGAAGGGLGAEAILRPSRTLGAEDRLAIYQRVYLARLCRALAGEYPSLVALLGEARFEKAVRAYFERHPPRGRSFPMPGRRFFPRFLGRAAPPDRRALVVDLARLEGLITEVAEAADATPLAPSALARVSPARLAAARLTPIPALRLGGFDHPVDALLDAAREGRPPGVLARRRSCILVWRGGNDAVRRAEISRPTYRLLRALAAGSTVGAATRAALGATSAPVRREAHAWLRDRVADGLFASVAW